MVEANLVTDRTTGRPRGFGFVTMSSPEEAQKAIDALNGKEMGGRAFTVNVARPRESAPAAVAVAADGVATVAAAAIVTDPGTIQDLRQPRQPGKHFGYLTSLAFTPGCRRAVPPHPIFL